MIHSSVISHFLKAPAIAEVLLARGGLAVDVRGGAGCANFFEAISAPKEWPDVEHPYRNAARRRRDG